MFIAGWGWGSGGGAGAALIAGAWADGAATLPDIPNGHRDGSLTEKFSNSNDLCATFTSKSLRRTQDIVSLKHRELEGQASPAPGKEKCKYTSDGAQDSQHSTDAFGRGVWGVGEHLECSFCS